ncbi:MAG: hypothetical protein OQK75_02485 [Gammaproteobacteria bacterium]|nr:hypothetical protein [Gammaproteobacteria bacterium]
MVNEIKVFVFLLLVSLSSVAEEVLNKEQMNKEQLVLFTDKTESALGRPIRAELYGISLKNKLDEISLKQLKNNFAVVIESFVSNTTDKRWPDQPIQILQLKLYPRYVGKITIPQLTISKLSSQEKSLNIIEGNTSVPEVTFSSIEPYEREQIQVHIKITSSDSTSRLSFKDSAVVKGFDYKPLLFKRTRQKNGNYLLEIGCAITPLKNGTYNLELPPIEYSLSGVARKRFFLPVKKIMSKILPRYLPPTIPVGKVLIKSNLSPAGILQKDSISYWNIFLQGQVSHSYKLPPVLRQLKSNEQIQILPVKSTHSNNVTNELLTSTVIHSIPFKALQNGFLTLPELRFQYFDPESEKINTVIYKEKRVFVLGIYARSIVIIVFLLLVFWVIWLIHKKWIKIKYSKNKREQAIELLKNPDHANDIRVALQLLAQSEFWPVNLTVSQWKSLWINKYQAEEKFDILIDEISCALYSSSLEHNLTELAENLRMLINNKKIL